MLGITTTNARVGGFRGGISAEAKTIYNRIIADGGVSNLTRLNFFVKGLKAIYGSLSNVPVCYDAHWIGYKLGSGTGATAGQAAAKLYSLTVAGDAVQSTAASQPLLLSHNGVDNYYQGVGITGNFCQSNTSTYNTNDIDIEAKVYTNATTGDINFINISNGTSTTVDFFYSKSSNAIAFQYYTGGFRSAFSVTTITDGDVFRVTRNSTTGAVVFKKNGTTITTSGSQVAGALDFSNTTIKIGQGLCKIYYANFYISGVLNKSCNPAEYNASTSQTQWTSSTGEIWTISTGTATTGYKGCLVSRTLVQGDGVDDNMASGTLSISGAKTNYLAVNILRLTVASTQYLIDSKNASENQVNLIYKDGLAVRMYTNTFVNFEPITSNVLRLLTGLVNSTSSLTKINNSNTATGTLSNKNITQLFLFSNQIGVTNGNAIINSYILSSVADTTIQQTATYNLVKSLNENAF
jgi:hypothetical protein